MALELTAPPVMRGERATSSQGHSSPGEQCYALQVQKQVTGPIRKTAALRDHLSETL